MQNENIIPANLLDTVMECLSLPEQHPLRTLVQEALIAYEDVKAETAARA